jgi:hypothetical protein
MHQLVKYSDLARLAYTLLRRGYEGESGPSSQNTVGRKIAKTVADLPRTQQVEVGLMDVLLRRFSEEVTASGVQFLVVLAGTPNINFDVQKGMLESAHLRYIDATSDGLATKLPGGIKDLYFPYNKHWTAAGHRVVAEMLAGVLREEKR